MTRFASIMGVAAVATLVLLSGCEAAMEKTDYAKQLAGTWQHDLMRNVNGVPSNSAVTATIERTGTNKGTLSLSVADTPVGAPLPASETEASGTIAVTSTKITVTDVDVTVTAAGVDVTDMVIPADQLALLAGAQEFSWEITGNKLKVSGAVLPILLSDPMITELEFTKK